MSPVDIFWAIIGAIVLILIYASSVKFMWDLAENPPFDLFYDVPIAKRFQVTSWLAIIPPIPLVVFPIIIVLGMAVMILFVLFGELFMGCKFLWKCLMGKYEG